jgi:hypothetical protein
MKIKNLSELKENLNKILEEKTYNNYKRNYYNINISKKNYIALDKLASKYSLKKSNLLDLIFSYVLKNLEEDNNNII